MISVFLTHIVPRTQDIDELKVMLYLLHLLDQGKRTTSAVKYEELLSCVTEMAGMGEEVLQRSLELAIDHGIVKRVGGGEGESFEFIPSLISKVNIFALYEQNVGMITPMVAEELKEAERIYPEQWINQAFKEAVDLNKRSWRYVSRILERWAREGKENGTYRRNPEEDGPDKYIKGKYGHLIRR